MKTYIKEFFSNDNWLKTLLLKFILSNEEKCFFSLIAPADSVMTKSAEGYLFQQGWWQSFNRLWYQNEAGEYTPWLTYPSIEFLKARLSDNFHVFEYGGGSSTLFWACRTKHVITIEHDQQWAKALKLKAPDHCHIIYQKIEPFTAFKNAIPRKKFHLILVDGRQRIKCLALAIDQLTPDGIIILDDSERPAYSGGKNHMQEAGFKELPFWGLRHRSRQASCTSIFYRANNCLGI